MTSRRSRGRGLGRASRRIHPHRPRAGAAQPGRGRSDRARTPATGVPFRERPLAHPPFVRSRPRRSRQGLSCYFAGLIRRRRARPTLVGLSCERLDDNLQAYVGGGRTALVAAAAFLGRAYIGMFDAHVANSDYTADELRRAMRPPDTPAGPRQPDGRRAADAAASARPRLDSPAAAEAVRSRGRRFFVGTPGRLSPEKNVDVLPDVLASLAGRARPVFLVVAGDGPLREALEERAAALAPGRTLFVGHIADSISPRPAHGKRRRVHPSESEGTVRDSSDRRHSPPARPSSPRGQVAWCRMPPTRTRGWRWK